MNGTAISSGINLEESLQPRIIAIAIITWSLALIGVALRFLCRGLTAVGFWWDDYASLLACLGSTVISMIVSTWMVPQGNLGKHFAVVASKVTATTSLKCTFIIEVCWVWVMATVKLSLLCLYWRLFNAYRWVRISIFALGGIMVTWAVAAILAIFFQCVPLRSFWDRGSDYTGRGTCHMNVKEMFYANAIPNILTDVLILVLPIRSIWMLFMTRWQKLCLSSIFILGGFTIGVSVTRFVYLLNLDLESYDSTWVGVNSIVWTCLEVNIATFGCCLPLLRPLVVLVGRLTPSMSKSTDAHSLRGVQPVNVSKSNSTSLRGEDLEQHGNESQGQMI